MQAEVPCPLTTQHTLTTAVDGGTQISSNIPSKHIVLGVAEP